MVFAGAGDGNHGSRLGFGLFPAHTLGHKEGHLVIKQLCLLFYAAVGGTDKQIHPVGLGVLYHFLHNWRHAAVHFVAVLHHFHLGGKVLGQGVFPIG